MLPTLRKYDSLISSSGHAIMLTFRLSYWYWHRYWRNTSSVFAVIYSYAWYCYMRRGSYRGIFVMRDQTMPFHLPIYPFHLNVTSKSILRDPWRTYFAWHVKRFKVKFKYPWFVMHQFFSPWTVTETPCTTLRRFAQQRK